MGHSGEIVIHANPRLAHQVEFANALKAGFSRHSLTAQITENPAQQGGTHVVLGPWYALQNWLIHPRVLYLDRCLIGDPYRVVSLGWLRNGAMRFEPNTDRRQTRFFSIKPKPWKRGGIRRVLVLCDYDYVPYVDTTRYDVTFRPHPANQAPEISLHDALARTDCAVGKKTSALVDAVLEGVPVVCADRASICYGVSGSFAKPYRESREEFINMLCWHNWHLNEIETGEACDYLWRFQ